MENMAVAKRAASAWSASTSTRRPSTTRPPAATRPLAPAPWPASPPTTARPPRPRPASGATLPCASAWPSWARCGAPPGRWRRRWRATTPRRRRRLRHGV